MLRPGIEPGSRELASCVITARPPQHDTTGPRHKAFDVFQGSCYKQSPIARDRTRNLSLQKHFFLITAEWIYALAEHTYGNIPSLATWAVSFRSGLKYVYNGCIEAMETLLTCMKSYNWDKSINQENELAGKAWKMGTNVITFFLNEENRIKGEVRRKMNFTYVLGFVVLRDVVKVFPVSSSSFARKTTWRNRAQNHSWAWRGLKTKWDLKWSRALRSPTYLIRYLFI